MDTPVLTLVRNVAVKRAISWRAAFFRRVYGMTIGVDTGISMSAKLDKTNPKGVVVGDHTRIAFGASVLTHDFVKGTHHTTTIGDYCLLGSGAIVMPGVTIGNHCIIGALTVVNRDVPDGSIVVGNPGKIVESNVMTGRWGVRGGRDAPSRKFLREVPIDSVAAEVPGPAAP